MIDLQHDALHPEYREGCGECFGEALEGFCASLEGTCPDGDVRVIRYPTAESLEAVVRVSHGGTRVFEVAYREGGPELPANLQDMIDRRVAILRGGIAEMERVLEDGTSGDPTRIERNIREQTLRADRLDGWHPERA